MVVLLLRLSRNGTLMRLSRCAGGFPQQQFEGAWGRAPGGSVFVDEFMQQQHQQRPGLLPPPPQHFQQGFRGPTGPGGAAAMAPPGSGSQMARPFLQVCVATSRIGSLVAADLTLQFCCYRKLQPWVVWAHAVEVSEGFSFHGQVMWRQAVDVFQI